MGSSPDPRQCAEELRGTHSINNVPRTQVLLALVRHLGASLVNMPEGPLQGSLAPAPDCLPGSWQVSVNRSMPSHRFRFSLAHELGHLYLRSLEYSGGREERWCNQFAAELLMPSDRIASTYANAPASLSTLNHLAHRYDVSRSAALVRLRHVLRWQRGLIGLRLREQSWTVTSMTAMPTVALYQLEPNASDGDIPRGNDISQPWLRFAFRTALIDILVECQRRGDWASALVNTADLEQACTEIMHGS